MANTVFKFRANSTSGVVPSGASLQTAEMGLNTGDGKLYAKMANGTVAQVRAGLYPDGDSIDFTTGNELMWGYDINNTVWNAGFEKGDYGWSKTGGWTINNDSTNARSGNWCAVCTGTSGFVTENSYDSVVTGETVVVSAYVKTTSFTGTFLRVEIVWYDKDKVSLSQDVATSLHSSPPTTYTQNRLEAQAPASAAYYRVRFRCNLTGGTAYVDDFFSYRKRDAGDLLSNGSVTVAMIGSNVAFTHATNEFSAVQRINVSSSSNALFVSQAGAGAALWVGDETDPDTTPYVIDAAGRQIIGHTAFESEWLATSRSGFKSYVVADETSTVAGNEMYLSYNDGSTVGPHVMFARSRGSTVGARGLVAAGDILGELNFAGDDNVASSFTHSTRLQAVVVGTPSNDSISSDFLILTRNTGDTGNQPSEKLRVAANGMLGVGGANYGTAGQYLRSNGTSTALSWANVAISEVTGLQANLDAKAANSHTHSATDVVSGTLADARLNGVYSNVIIKVANGSTVFSNPSTGSTHSLGRTVFRLAEYRGSSISTTGAIVFSAPSTTTDMFYEFNVEGYVGGSPGDTYDVTVLGYANSSGWFTTMKTSRGTADPQVRLAKDGSGRDCLILGDTGTVWNRPHFTVTRAMMSHSNAADAHCYDWTVSLSTDLSAFTVLTSSLQTSGPANGVVLLSTMSDLRTATANTLRGTDVYVRGYNSGSNRGGGLFKYESANTNADDGGIVVVDGSSRRWVRQLTGPVNQYMFGAYGNGTTNDQPYVQNCFSWADTNQQTVALEAGVHLLNSNVGITVGNPDSLVIRGPLGQTCTFVVNSTTGGLYFSIGTKPQLTLADFSVEPGSNTAGYGIWIEGPGFSGSEKRTAVVQSINMNSRDGASSDYAFDVPLKVSGCKRPIIRDVQYQAGVNSYRIASALIDVSNSYQVKIRDCWMNSRARYGVKNVYTDGSGNEGFSVMYCNFVKCDYGIFYQDAGRSPNMQIVANHVNSLIENVHIDGLKYGYIYDNVFYINLDEIRMTWTQTASNTAVITCQDSGEVHLFQNGDTATISFTTSVGSNVAGTAAVTTGQVNLVSTGYNLTTNFTNGDYVFVYTNSTSYDSRIINRVVNSTFMNVTAAWSATNAAASFGEISFAPANGTYTVANTDSNTVFRITTARNTTANGSVYTITESSRRFTDIRIVNGEGFTLERNVYQQTKATTRRHVSFNVASSNSANPVIRETVVADDQFMAKTTVAPYYVGNGASQITITWKRPGFSGSTSYPNTMVEVDAGASNTVYYPENTKAMFVSNTAPTSPQVGDVWIDIS